MRDCKRRCRLAPKRLAQWNEQMALTVSVGVGPVTFDDVVAVARDGAAVAIGDGVAGDPGRARATSSTRSRATPSPHYGISTGFGALATTPHPCGRAAPQLQPR